MCSILEISSLKKGCQESKSECDQVHECETIKIKITSKLGGKKKKKILNTPTAKKCYKNIIHYVNL